MDESIDFDHKKAAVKQQSCFVPLSEVETTELANLLVEKHFSKGDVIVVEGDLVDSVFLIIQGQADVRVTTIKDRVKQVKSVATLTVGSAIGLNESGFYSLTGKRTATVVALTDMVVLRLSVAKFHGLALAYPHVNEVMRKSGEKFTTNSS